MSVGPVILSLGLMVMPFGPSGDDEPTFLGEALEGSKFAAEGNQQYEQQKRVRSATDVAGDETNAGMAMYPSQRGGGQSDPGRDYAAYAPRGDDFQAIGVCMLTDLEPAVENLPACADLLDPDEPDETPSEDDDEAAAEDTPEPIIITVTRSDFAELPLNQPRVHLQPDRDWFLVNMDTLVYTDGAPQVLQTTVLDVPVAVRATPVQYAWDFGDGTQPLVTTEPGAPWPATDIAHVYTSEATDVVVTLTTTWSGEFQVAGQGPWIPIAGTTTTDSQSAPFRVDAVETRLTAEG